MKNSFRMKGFLIQQKNLTYDDPLNRKFWFVKSPQGNGIKRFHTRKEAINFVLKQWTKNRKTTHRGGFFCTLLSRKEYQKRHFLMRKNSSLTSSSNILNFGFIRHRIFFSSHVFCYEKSNGILYDNGVFLPVRHSVHDGLRHSHYPRKSSKHPARHQFRPLTCTCQRPVPFFCASLNPYQVRK